MNYFGKIYSTLSQAYSEINPATLTGAIDVIVVEQEDGSYVCSPFHVRFGKMGVLRSREKIVDIEINNLPVDIHMKLGDNGEAYFLEECDDDDDDDDNEEDEEEEEEEEEENGNVDASSNCDEMTVNEDQVQSSKAIAEVAAAPAAGHIIIDEKNEQKIVAAESLSMTLDDETICDSTPELSVQSAELGTPDDSVKSESITSISSAQGGQGSSQKRVRRKKKTRTLSKQSSIQSDTAAKQNKVAEQSPTESVVDNNRHHHRNNSNPAIESETPTHHEHPFSDSEVSSIQHSQQKFKQGNEPPYDCKSDTEYEVCKYDQSIDKISWDWGELPTELVNENKFKDRPNDAAECDGKSKSPRSSMLGGVLGFIIKDKDTAEEDKGIYLDDLDPNDMKPEVAAKYFPKFASRNSFSYTGRSNTSDEEFESGNGPSLSNSPNSTEFYYPQHDFDEKCLSSFDLATLSKIYHDMSMSLCGGIEKLYPNPSDSEHFLQSIISFDDFSENPLQILDNPNLVIRMGGRYYTWKMAASIILSLLMFQRPLPENTLIALKDQCIPKKKHPAPNSWRSWFSSRHSAGAQPADGNASPPNAHLQMSNTDTKATDNSSNSGNIVDTQSLDSSKSDDSLKLNSSKTQSSIQLEYTSDDETRNIVLSSSNKAQLTASKPDDHNYAAVAHKKTKYRKVLRLKSDVIKSLNLQPNSNDVKFSVTTAYQGTTYCRSKIFLWRYDDQIIISDIDGTITKSDVLGHILPMIGKDWAQVGVTKLYTNIMNNGYKFLYLSARAIGQAQGTRDYLQKLEQEGVCLPDGPVLLSPTSLFSALHREVIEKKPEEFKIGCLNDIQTLFPQNPFFAGFGNKKNDNVAYNAVGIDSSRIFTINPRGEVKLERILSFKSSYSDLSQIVDQMFPPLKEKSFYDGFSSFMFWRPDFLDVELDQEIANKS